MSPTDTPANFNARVAERAARKAGPLDTLPLDPALKPHGTLPNTPLTVALISFILGILFFSGTALAVLLVGPPRQLGFFVAAWAVFHWAEFAVTAGWNRDKLSVDSFLLNNGMQYHAANSAAMLEWATTFYFFPQWKEWPHVTVVGIALTLAGQCIRSTAMIHASVSFSHSVAFRKAADHRLVTDGIYAWFRHPSYAGFFYWGLGTQLVLQNPISFAVFLVVLWRFFYHRIQNEERLLIRFFGDDYIAYRQRVGTKIPAIH